MHKRTKRIALVIGAMFLHCVPSFGQDTVNQEQLDEIIIRFHQKTTTYNMLDPINSQKIGEEELMKAACCNLSESFETTPSVDVAYTDAITGYKQIRMLGLSGPNTALTRENIPDARGLASITGLSFTPGSWIKSMQLSKGAGSVVNGYEGVAGQINVEWKKPFQEKEKWFLNLYQSAQGRSEANLIHNLKINDRLSTNIFLHGRSQWLKTDENSDGFLDQPLDQLWIGANRWFWFAPNHWELQAGIKAVSLETTGGQWNYERAEQQEPGAPWGFELGLKRLEGWAKIGKIISSRQATSMGLQIAAIYHDQNGKYGLRNYGGNEKSFYLNYIFQTYIHDTRHTFKTGASLEWEEVQENLADLDYERMERVPGIFGEYSYDAEKWNLVAGLRADFHNHYGAFFTPRVHFRYAPFSETVVRASVGRAQHTPDIFAENTGIMASNRQFILPAIQGRYFGLSPEVAWNLGVNLTQKFRLDYRAGSVGVDYYHTRFQDQIVVDIEDPYTVRFYNLDGLSFANSFQAQLDYELIHKFDLRVAYRWHDVRTTLNSELKERPLVARHRAFLNAGYETDNDWKFDYTVQWTGTKRVPARVNDQIALPEDRSPSFFLMNTQVTKSWGTQFELYAGVENLLNFMMDHPVLNADHPYDPGFDASLIWGPVMGRNLYAGLRLRFP